MPKLGIWVLYIMSWILDEYPFEESLIMLCAALDEGKLEAKILCVTAPVVKGFVRNMVLIVLAVLGTLLTSFEYSIYIKLMQGS